jgi:hypothetical protein
MATPKDSPIVEGIASYGRVKATIGFSFSCLFATSLLAAGIFSFVQNKKPREIKGTVVSVDYCSRNDCKVTIKYMENDLENRIQVSASRNVKVGDTISTTQGIGRLGSIGLVCVGIILLICGLVYLKYVLNNKYAAIDSAMSSHRSYGYGYGYNPGLNIRL